MTWLSVLNKILAVVTILVYLGVGMTALCSRTEPLQLSTTTKRSVCLATPFAQEDAAYEQIGQGALFALHYTPPQAQLPDLRHELGLYGIDERPDADPDHPLVHVGFCESKAIHVLPAGEQHYLAFDREQGTYNLSPQNRETNLWVALEIGEDSRVEAHVGMTNGVGELVATPTSHAHFELEQIRGPRPTGKWELGSNRVDNSLLARLHARWYGEDLFLHDHGGTEYATAIGKQRIDFGTGETLYSCFVKPGDYLVWKNDRWHNLAEGESSRGLPLLYLKTLKEKLMLFELWDAAGRSRITLSVMRAKDLWLPHNLKEALRFVGAKTWSEYVLHTGNGRVVVSPQEWLLFNEGEWQVLNSVEEIDQYVAGNLRGELLVLEGLTREGGTQALEGHLYNSSRTEMESVRIPLNPQFAESNYWQKRSSYPSNERQVDPKIDQLLPEELAFEEEEIKEELLSLPTLIRGLAEQLKEPPS